MRIILALLGLLSCVLVSSCTCGNVHCQQRPASDPETPCDNTTCRMQSTALTRARQLDDPFVEASSHGGMRLVVSVVETSSEALLQLLPGTFAPNGLMVCDGPVDYRTSWFVSSVGLDAGRVLARGTIDIPQDSTESRRFARTSWIAIEPEGRHIPAHKDWLCELLEGADIVLGTKPLHDGRIEVTMSLTSYVCDRPFPLLDSVCSPRVGWSAAIPEVRKTESACFTTLRLGQTACIRGGTSTWHGEQRFQITFLRVVASQ